MTHSQILARKYIIQQAVLEAQLLKDLEDTPNPPALTDYLLSIATTIDELGKDSARIDGEIRDSVRLENIKRTGLLDG